MTNHPFIVDNRPQAEALGIAPELMTPRNLETITFLNGRYVVPLQVEYSWESANEDDSDFVADAKAFARETESRFMGYFKAAAAQAAKIDKDMRFSRTGKDEAWANIYETFISRVSYGEAIAGLAQHMSAIYGELLNAQSPPELRPTDAVGAIQDMELRRVLLDRPWGERVGMLNKLVAEQPSSPLLIAALRNSPEAVGLTSDQMRGIRAAYATKTKPREIATAWMAASGLAFVHSLLDQGNVAIASLAGKFAPLQTIPIANILAKKITELVAQYEVVP